MVEAEGPGRYVLEGGIDPGRVFEIETSSRASGRRTLRWMNASRSRRS